MKELNVIKIDAEYDVGRDYEDVEGYGSFRFIDNFDTNDLINVMDELSKQRGLEVDHEELFASYVFNNEPNVLEVYNEELENEWTFEDFSTWLLQGTEYLELLTENMEAFTNFTYGTVGYSQWTYYVADKLADAEYINSIWEGTDHYSFQIVDKEGEFLDGCGYIYCPDYKISTILGWFNLEDEDVEYKLYLSRDVGYLTNDTELKMATLEIKEVWS